LPGLQSYGARLNVGFFELGPVSLLAGTEAGWLKFDGIETVSGTGTFGQAYLGFEVPIGGRFKLEADAGPAIYQLNAEGQAVNGSDLIFNAAFYLYVW
jgi:hypothetical protein